MFLVVIAAAVYAGSSALLAGSLDNLGDALTYGLSLFVVAGAIGAKAKVALFKGVFILLAAMVVAGQITYRLFVPGVPIFEVMGIFSLVGLAANSICHSGDIVCHARITSSSLKLQRKHFQISGNLSVQHRKQDKHGER